MSSHNNRKRLIEQSGKASVKKQIPEDLRKLRCAIFEEEMKRAERVIIRCKEMENLHNKTSLETINNEHHISTTYEESKKQADINEKKRQ